MEYEICCTRVVENLCVASIRTLISQGADVNEKFFQGYTLLCYAVRKKNVEAINLLISAGADVNLKTENDQTALHFAFDCDDLQVKADIIKMLIEAGADVNAISNGSNRRTALQVAVLTGNFDLIKFLIDRGANVNAKDEFSRIRKTALHYAADNYFSLDPSVFELLLSSNANIYALDFLGQTPLHLLIYSHRKDASLLLGKVVDIFVKHGADFNALNNHQQTPMDVALEISNQDAIKILILHNAVNVNSIYNLPAYFPWRDTKKTILHQSCLNYDLQTVKFLLKNGADINKVDLEGVSPLQFVIDLYNIAMTTVFGPIVAEKIMKLLKYLLRWNPDINIITNETRRDVGRNILIPQKECSSFGREIWQLIIQHLAKVQTIQKISISDSLSTTISINLNYLEYFEKCKKELEVANDTKLHPDCWMTFLDFILLDDKKKLFFYSGNEHIVEGLTKILSNEKFIIYGPSVEEKFFKAFEKRKIWEQALKTLGDLLPILVDPTHCVVQKILSFF